MEREFSEHQDSVGTDTAVRAGVVALWSLGLFLVSFIALGLLLWLSSDEHMLPVCEFLTVLGFGGLGVGLLTPVYTRCERKLVPVVLTVVYVAFAVVAGAFVVAMSAWTLYSNGCCGR